MAAAALTVGITALALFAASAYFAFVVYRRFRQAMDAIEQPPTVIHVSRKLSRADMRKLREQFEQAARTQRPFIHIDGHLTEGTQAQVTVKAVPPPKSSQPPQPEEPPS